MYPVFFLFPYFPFLSAQRSQGSNMYLVSKSSHNVIDFVHFFMVGVSLSSSGVTVNVPLTKLLPNAVCKYISLVSYFKSSVCPLHLLDYELNSLKAVHHISGLVVFHPFYCFSYPQIFIEYVLILSL